MFPSDVWRMIFALIPIEALWELRGVNKFFFECVGHDSRLAQEKKRGLTT